MVQDAFSLRSDCKKRRQNALSLFNQRCLRRHMADFCLKLPQKRWGLVWPLEGEPDLRPLCFFLHQKGKEIFLPETFPEKRVMIFRRWTPHVRMAKGAFGTFYPQDEQDFSDYLEGIAVPLLAYDSKGNRLGYGGGFYDKFLFEHPELFRLGYGLSAQYRKCLNPKEHDQRLDALATEKRITVFAPRNRTRLIRSI